MASPWHSSLSAKLEPKLIEHNLEPLSEESSSTLYRRLTTFGQGFDPFSKQAVTSRIPSVVSD